MSIWRIVIYRFVYSGAGFCRCDGTVIAYQRKRVCASLWKAALCCNSIAMDVLANIAVMRCGLWRWLASWDGFYSITQCVRVVCIAVYILLCGESVLILKIMLYESGGCA